MKTKLLLFMTLFAFSIFSSCDKTEKGEDKTPTLELSAQQTTINSVSFSMKALDATSIAYVITKGAVEELQTPENIYSVGSIVDSKEAVYEEKNLDSETLYTIQAVAKNDNGVFSTVKKIELKTQKEEPKQVTISAVLGEVTFNSIAFKVTSENAQKIAYLVKEGSVNEMPEVTSIFKDGIESSVKESFIINDLKDETIYTIFIAAKNDKIYSETIKLEATTKNKPLLDFTVELEAVTVEPTRAHLRATPSDLKQLYALICEPTADYPNLSTPEEYAQALFDKYGDEMKEGAGLVADVQENPNVKVSPETEYFLIAFAFDGEIASKPQMIKFTTPAGSQIENVTYSAEVVDIYSVMALIKVTPDPTETYFYAGVVKASEYSEDVVNTSKAEFEQFLADELEEYQGYDPSYTMEDMVEWNAKKGISNFNFTKLEPDTDYTVFIYGVGLDGKTSKMTHLEENMFKTIIYTPSNASYTTEFYKSFSGTEASKAGLLSDLGMDLKGKAVVVVKNIKNEHAVSFKTCSSYGTDDSPDEAILNSEWFTWIEYTSLPEYTIHIFSWAGYDFTVFSVANLSIVRTKK